MLYIVNDFDCNPLNMIQQSKAQTFLVYANIDYANTLYPDLSAKEKEDKWRLNFNELFKKTPLLTSLVLNAAQKEELVLQLQHKIKSILNTSTYKCYGFSDSIRFLETIKEKENIHLVEGNPFHMDNFGDATSIDGHLKTLLDFFMLSESEAVYFLRCGKMYHSSFSKYAAIIGNKPFKIITD